jgi:hypothetical protein
MTYDDVLNDKDFYPALYGDDNWFVSALLQWLSGDWDECECG